MQSKVRTCSRSSVVAFALFCWGAARADEAIVFNPKTYLIEGRLVLTPTPNMVVWDGGGAYRAGTVWVGNGWREFPGGQGALTSMLLEEEEIPTPRRRRRIDTSMECDAALLMWRNY